MDQITADDNILALYKQVELVILGFRLAFRALLVAQFPEIYSNIPTHVGGVPDSVRRPRSCSKQATTIG